MKEINATDCAKARKLAHVLADSWFEVQPSDALRARALQLVDRYDLRAADSLQLAAALEWCEDDPSGRVFLTVDARLREAALLTGFDTKNI
jgi:predicted nucleic acid-binding protein